MAEHPAVNRRVVGSNPTHGVMEDFKGVKVRPCYPWDIVWHKFVNQQTSIRQHRLYPDLYEHLFAIRQATVDQLEFL